MIGKTAPMSMSSRARVTFLDAATGERVPAINAETGEEFWGGEWHPNMITDAGLDHMAVRDFIQNGQGTNRLTLTNDLPEIKESSGATVAEQTGTTVTASAPFFSAADVGRAIVWADGSNARIVSYISQTSVQTDKTQSVPAQVFERWHVDISSLPGPLRWGTTGSEGAAGSWDDDHYIITATSWRQVELSTNMNINGFGLGASDTTDASIIENLRDSSGNPITVSLLAGKAVRVDHVLEFRFPRAAATVQVSIDEYDAANQLVGTTTHEADLWLAPQSLSDGNIQGAFRAINPSSFNIVTSTSNINFVARFLGSRPFTPGEISSGTPSYTPSANSLSDHFGSYTPGARRRTKALTAAAAYANGDVYGVLFRSSRTSQFGALILQFREGEQLVKESSHTLTLGFEISWDRDYTIG